MKTFLAAALLAVFAGCVAPEFHAAPAVQPAPSADTASAWAAPQEPLDVTVITPVESAGASSAE
ncbi:MAG: hypothetical protein ABL916_24195 [Burkholderiaceae bacterium]